MANREQLIEHEKRESPLSHREIEEAEHRSSTTAIVVHEAIRLEGTEELERPSTSVGWSALAAGLTICTSMLGQGILMAALPDTPWRPLIAAFGYTLGFIFVTMGRQQLFTETTLTAMLPVLHGTHGGGEVARYWAVVLVANIIGTLLFAAAMLIPHLLRPEFVDSFTRLGVKAVEPGFLPVLAKAVVAGWLIALMVWLMPAAGSARILVIVAVTWLIAAGEFSHVIAGSAEAAFAAMRGASTWSEYAVGFLLPAFIGNSIGGVVFVALLNHAQVKKEL